MKRLWQLKIRAISFVTQGVYAQNNGGQAEHSDGKFSEK